jgi:hypothetical protein
MAGPTEALISVIQDKCLIRDIRKLTKACHTGAVESFNSALLRYTPKRLHFSHSGMIARTQLAVLGHNSNLKRKQAVDKEGNLRYGTAYPKRTKDWVAKNIYEPKDPAWRHELLSVICCVHRRELNIIPLPSVDTPKNIASKPKPPKRQLIDSHVSRFLM